MEDVRRIQLATGLHVKPASWLEKAWFMKARQDATVIPEGWSTREISAMKFWIVHCGSTVCWTTEDRNKAS